MYLSRGVPSFSIAIIIVLALASISAVATPVYLHTQNGPDYLPPSFDLSEGGPRLPCNHAEDHVQYLCKVSGGGEEMELSIDSSNENRSWLPRANGQLLTEFETGERRVIEKYIKLAQSSHATHLAFFGQTDSIRVSCTLMPPHDHWRHKKIGFLHIVDVLSILGVGIIALAVWVSTVVFGGGKGPENPDGSIVHEIKTRTHRARRSTTSLFTPAREEKRIA
ncbi:hypothetical protein PM082_017400 [Marasmius tenuissimus]|nr:hypothetical protein PM082_017400 [Marasmius tenuissimus]